MGSVIDTGGGRKENFLRTCLASGGLRCRLDERDRLPDPRTVELAVPLSLDAVLWALVVVLTLWAAWLSLPRPPELDWERLFKTTLVTVLRGPLEAVDAPASRWLEEGRSLVWFHPGSRGLLEKLADPAAYTIPVPALAGERALVEDLVGLDSPDARLRRIFEEEPRGDEVLYDDPLLLGEDYAPTPILGPEVDWEALSRWDATVREGLRRRGEHLRWGVVGDSALAEALEAELGQGRAVALDVAAPKELVEALSTLVPGMADRLVLVGAGEGAAALVRALHHSDGLRDRVRAVIGLAAALGGETRGWLAEHFTHREMDTELSRTTPYFHLAWAVPGTEPPGERGRPLADTAWPSVEVPETGREAFVPVDLGLLAGSRAACERELLARALLITVTHRLAVVG